MNTALCPSAFSTRGHHIKTFTELLPPINKKPEEIARNLREKSVKDRGLITPETVDWSILTDPQVSDREYDPTYGYDLVGSTDAQADSFESSYAAVLRGFISLAGNAAVRLTINQPDGICKSCVFQRHCQQAGTLDAKYLAIFEDVFAFAQSKDPTFNEPMARTYNDDIETTAYGARRVMSHFAIAGLIPYEDALLRREKYGHVLAGPSISEVELYYDNFSHEIV